MSRSPETPDHLCRGVGSAIHGRGEELRALRAPLLVNGVNIGDPDIHEARDYVARGHLEGHGGLVLGRPAAAVDDDPAIGERDHGRLALAYDFAAGDVRVEALGPLDVVGHDEMSQEDPGLRIRPARGIGVL